MTVALCALAALITFVFGAIVGAVVAIVGIENQRRYEEAATLRNGDTAKFTSEVDLNGDS